MEELSITKSAKKWGIKITTLQDRLSSQVEVNRRRGPPPILTKQEKNQFADWPIVMANWGSGVSKESLLNTIKTFLDKDGRTTPLQDNKPGNKWFCSFVKRNTQINLQKSQPLEKKRAMISKEYLDAWFNGFENFLLRKISQISRCGKSGTGMRLVSICKAEQRTSLAHLTEKKRCFASFQEAKSMLLHYLVLTHVASGCPHISFFLERAFPLLTIR